MFAPLAAADLRARCLESVYLLQLSLSWRFSSCQCSILQLRRRLVRSAAILVPWVFHEASLFGLPHLVHGGQRRFLLVQCWRRVSTAPISIATPVHPSATASRMAGFTV